MEDTKMSKKAKIVLWVSVVVVLCAVAVLVFIFTKGGNNATTQPIENETIPEASTAEPAETETKTEAKTETPAPKKTPSESAVRDYNKLSTAIADVSRKEALDSIWKRLNGYRTSGDKFVRFNTNKNGDHDFEYGLLQSGFVIMGKITGARATGEYAMDMTLHVPAVPATEMDDAKPEKTETIYFDLSHFDADGRINVKIKNFGNSEWHTYKYGGNTLKEVYSK